MIFKIFPIILLLWNNLNRTGIIKFSRNQWAFQLGSSVIHKLLLPPTFDFNKIIQRQNDRMVEFEMKQNWIF